MLVYVLGAPGSGKSTLVPLLRRRLERWVVLDWDFLLEASAVLVGSDLRATPSRWAAYDDLVLTTVAAIASNGLDCVVLGVRTPAELSAWPVDAWLLLDCPDAERADRLRASGRAGVVADAIADAAAYRSLGLPSVDAAARPADVAAAVEELLGRADARYREV